MVNQQYFIPVVPDSAPIVVHTSQGDYDAAESQGRLCFNLIYDGIAYDTDSAVARIQGTKPDGTVFGYDAEVDGSVVRVKLTSQMTAVPGRVVCNLVLTNDDGAIGTFVIWLEVQSSALDPNADISHTEIPALIDLAQEEAQRAEDAADRAEDAADLAESWSQNPPYIGLNGHWFVYDVSTETFVDSGVDARGRNGSKWYYGTVISGKSSTPTAFPSSGITYAYENDAYLNKTEGAIYHCTLEGNASTAKWVYDMTLSGGGGGSVVTWTQIQTSTGATKIAEIDIDGSTTEVYAPSGGGGSAYTAGNGIDSTELGNGKIQLDYGTVSAGNTTKPVTGKAVNDALPAVNDATLTIQQNGTSKGTFTANASSNTTANIVTDEFVANGSPSSGSVTFSGIDDTVNSGACGYDVYFDITSNSTNKAPYAKLTSISGEGTNNMSLTYETDADNGTNTAHLRQVK